MSSSLLAVIKKNKDLIRPALIDFLRKRKAELLRELRDIEAKIREYEDKWGDFEEFEEKLSEGFESHETWFEWKALLRLHKEISEEIENIDRALEEIIREL